MRGRVWLAVVCILAVIALPSCARFRPMMHSDEAVGTRAARHNLPDNESGIEVRPARAIVQTDFESGTDESDCNVPPVPDDRFHESGERRQSVDEKNRFVDDVSASLEPASPSSYTLVELEQIAFENNPTIAQSQANVGAAHGRHCQAGLSPNPTIGYMGQEIGASGTAGQQGAFIEQEFVRGDKLGLSQDVVSEDINRLSWEFEVQRYRVQTSVRKGFYEVLTAQRQVELAERLLATSDKGAGAAEALLNAKQGTKVDLLQARVEVNNARIVLQTSRNRLQAAWKRLATNLGMPHMTPATLVGDVEAESQMLNPDQALQQIFATSPELAAAQAKVARASAAHDRACAEPTPNVTVQLGAMYDYSEEIAMAQVQVGLPLPIHNRNQGNIQAAESAIIAAHREVERVRLELENRFASVLERYQNAQVQRERFRQNILPDAAESLELVTQGYRLGELDYLRYLTAQRTNFQTNLDYLSALQEWWSARLEIEGALLVDGLRAPAAD